MPSPLPVLDARKNTREQKGVWQLFIRDAACEDDVCSYAHVLSCELTCRAGMHGMRSSRGGKAAFRCLARVFQPMQAR